MTKQATIEFLLEKIDQLTKRVDRLEQENTMLKEKLAKYENPKNSRNSSVPPSKDENRPLKTKGLREKTDKKVGGQPGHEGNTLKMTTTPDKIIDHIPNYCNCCGNDITDFPCEVIGKRQVVDIPPVRPEYTEHRVYQKTCSCGHIAKSDFPAGVNTSISYGSNVESMIGYFHARQYIPFDRMKEIFHDIFGLPVSEGGLHHILNRLSAKALPVYELIREKIANSPVVGTDETSVKVNGKKYWYWTWQNEKLTFIACSNNRGFKTIEENFKGKFGQSILVNDCWKSHFQTGAQAHQLCLAHLFRELNYFTEKYKTLWPVRFKKILKKAIDEKKQMIYENYHQPYQPRSAIEKSLKSLLDEDINEKHKELLSFKKRMVKYKEYLLPFLFYPKVPPDNNGSERAIRNVKVKQKISGQFKSEQGAKQFAILRSITDTAIKNGQNVLNSLFIIANLKLTD